MNRQMCSQVQSNSRFVFWNRRSVARNALVLIMSTLASTSMLQGCDASEDSSPTADAAEDSDTTDVAVPDITTPAPDDSGGAGDDATDSGAPPPGHCCSAGAAGYVDCGPFGTGPSLEACPPGYQCLGELNPYCYARQPGTCVAIPETCPDVGPEAAVVAECTDMLGDLPLTYASECHARQAGYIWILRPASEM